MKYIITLVICSFYFNIQAQIDTSNITIVRDQWGVPHIFTQTDEEAAYGLAWAHAEDDFEQIQEPLLIARGLLGSVKGKDGALLDAVSFMVNAEKIVNEQYDSIFSPKLKKMLSAYVSSLNRFAELHPEEVAHPHLFPATEKDIAKGYVLATALISNIQFDIARLFQNSMESIQNDLPGGSNGFAFAPEKTTDGKTYLISNSHQPLRSFTSWYEVHIHTEEGWNFLGATFAGGLTPFVGTNEHLGWTHCINYNDFCDVYALRMHPKEKLKYKFDGQWLSLKERVFKTKVKFGFLKLGFRKKFYESKHGIVIKNKTGFYALRFPANMVLGAAEQWYHMNKATNLTEFKAALSLQQQPSLTTTYADKEGNILYLDNGLFPVRDPNYNHWKVLPGDTSATLWKPSFLPVEKLLQIENPSCGYLHHSNGAGFYTTAPECQPSPENYLPAYQRGKTARNIRLQELFAKYADQKISYDAIKEIKYDRKLSFPLYNRTIQNLDLLRNLSVEKYPELRDIINVTKKWNGQTTADNKQAAIFSLAIQYILKKMGEKGIPDINGDLPEAWYAESIKFARKHLLKYFGSLEIELGALQKHVRGDKIMPIGGVPEAVATMYTVPYKKKYLQSNVGESYILFARYSKEGIDNIESINCYGASNRPESKHYNDQMDLYLQKKTKKMSLDKSTIMQHAVRSYHPR